jgi:TfoX/Sxy family transcriptional regulator of competence genes
MIPRINSSNQHFGRSNIRLDAYSGAGLNTDHPQKRRAAGINSDLRVEITSMATETETVEFILGKLHDSKRFYARAMFGEYALYADGKVVGLICDDRLYVKILPASAELESLCEKGNPYPGARLYYLVEKGQLSTLINLPRILFAIARSAVKSKKSPATRRSAVRR